MAELVPAFRYLSLSVDHKAPDVEFYFFDGNTLWGAIGPTLVRSNDRGKTWAAVYTFQGADSIRIRGVLVTHTGAMLAIVLSDKTTRMFRSPDTTGSNWAEVMTLNYESYNLKGFTETPLGIFWGEYLGYSPDKVHVWRSTDDGKTWSSLIDWKFHYTGYPEPVGEDHIRHVHAVQWDPHEEKIWIATGDLDSQCRVYTYDGRSVTLVGSGDQTWRYVYMLFFPECVILPTDSLTSAGVGSVFRIHRGTGHRDTLPERMSALSYTSVMTDSNVGLIFTSPESHISQPRHIDVYEVVPDRMAWIMRIDGYPEYLNTNVGFRSRVFQDGEYLYTDLVGVPSYMDRHFVRFKLGNAHSGRWLK
jgi:hypothetical protein